MTTARLSRKGSRSGRPRRRRSVPVARPGPLCPHVADRRARLAVPRTVAGRPRPVRARRWARRPVAGEARRQESRRTT